MFKLWTSKKTLLNKFRESIQASFEQAKYTPDRLLLAGASKQLVFEYGDLRNNFARSKIFGDVSPFSGWTEERFYVWTHAPDNHTFPIATRFYSLPQMPRERIKGDVFIIPSDQLIYIDNHRENGVKFKRKQIKILLPWFKENKGRNERAYTKAWIYLATPYWDDKFEWESKYYRGRKVNSFGVAPINEIHDSPDIGRFYDFTQGDCITHDKSCSRKEAVS